jgi:hypothetical protein
MADKLTMASISSKVRWLANHATEEEIIKDAITKAIQLNNRLSENPALSEETSKAHGQLAERYRAIIKGMEGKGGASR